jgi:hypothetical protein
MTELNISFCFKVIRCFCVVLDFFRGINIEIIKIQLTNKLAQQLLFYQNELPRILELGLRLMMTEKQPTSKSSSAINLWQWLDKPVTGKFRCTSYR